MLKVKLLSENAKMPTKAYSDDAGYDLYSAIDIFIPAGGQAIVPTDISINGLSLGMYARIAPRSGFAVKNMALINAGVIDRSYTGNIKIVVVNLQRENTIEIKKHDRIAQMIIEYCVDLPLVLVDEIKETDRNSAGFGSSGI